MNPAAHVESVAHRLPDRPALVQDGRSLGYGELDLRAGRLAAGLARLGVARGDRVALLLPNGREFVITYLAVQKLGAVAVSINPLLKRGEVGYILGDSGARVLVTDAEGRARAPEQPPLERIVQCGGAAPGAEDFGALVEAPAAPLRAVDLPEGAPAALVYSSGTTGFPKGVTLSHGNLAFNSASKVRYCGIRAVDRLLLFLPLSHCFGQNAVMNAAFAAGATLVVHRRFELEAVLRSVAADGVTMFFGVPTVFALLLSHAAPSAFATVRYFFSAAATLPAAVAARWQERFALPIHEGYGLTETSPFACYNHERAHRIGSIGSPIDGVSMRVADPDTGAELPAGEVGEIQVRGPNVMLGYWNRPDDTAAAVRDGWLRTGDLGRVDADGYFHLVDRLKDMINVGGLKVFPAEVENALHLHPGVLEAAVYAVPDPMTGERVAAQVIPRPGAHLGADALRAHCRELIADYKVPVAVEIVDALPRTASGKVLRRELRAAAARARP